MQTFQFALRRFIPFFLFILLTAVTLAFLLQPRELVGAKRVILKNGDLVSIAASLGEKKLTNLKDVKILFDQKNGKILFGKGWGNENTEDSERIGGTELWLFDEKTSQFSKIQEGFDVTDALLSPSGKVFFTTRDQNLMVSNANGSQKKLLQEKALSISIASDGTKLLYQKLPSDWSLGQYFDGALGLTLLDIASNIETRLATDPGEWGATFIPNGKKIIFVAPNNNGIASFFSMNIDGTGRIQLANHDQTFVSEKTIPVLSERPIFSNDGRFMAYESDREIWILRFNADATKVESAKRIAYGINPQWITQGKTLSVDTAPGSTTKGDIRIDVDGNTVR